MYIDFTNPGVIIKSIIFRVLITIKVRPVVTVNLIHLWFAHGPKHRSSSVNYPIWPPAITSHYTLTFMSLCCSAVKSGESDLGVILSSTITHCPIVYCFTTTEHGGTFWKVWCSCLFHCSVNLLKQCTTKGC